MKPLCIISIFVHLLLLNQASGQQLPLFTQYRAYHSIINPASLNEQYLRDDEKEHNGLGLSTTYLACSYRRQWLSLDKEVSPVNYIFQGEHLLFRGKFKLNVGAHFIKDDINPIATNGAYLKVAPYLKLGAHSGISVGFSFGHIGYRLNGDNIQAYHAFDPALMNSSNNQSLWNLGTGIYFHTRREGKSFVGRNSSDFDTWDRIYFGMAIPQLFSGNFNTNRQSNNYSFTLKEHLFLNGGIISYFGIEDFIEFSFWYKTTNSNQNSLFDFFAKPAHLDINLRYYFVPNQMSVGFWFGLGTGVRSYFGTTIHIEAGIQLENDMTFGLVLDHNFSTIKKISNSVEFNFGFPFKHKKSN